MKIVETKEFSNIRVLKEQQIFISTEEKINSSLLNLDCIGFYANEENKNIGFALLRKYEVNAYFLWNFIIDYNYQNKGKGKMFLNQLIEHMKNNYDMKTIVTTYIYENEQAKNYMNH